MRRCLLMTLLIVAPLLACQPAETPAQEPAEEAAAEELAPPNRGTVQTTIGGAEITVNYGRPELKGRDMLGQLGNGGIWRLGMNEATRLETTNDLLFGETSLASGSYSLFAKKLSRDEWHLIFNSEADIWGTQRNPDKDVAEVLAEVLVERLAGFLGQTGLVQRDVDRQ